MTVGSDTFKGLAVPLQGQSEITQLIAGTDILTLTGASSMSASADFLVCRDTEGTELLYLRSDGFLRLNPTTTVSAYGIDVRHTASNTTATNVAANFALTMGAVAVTGGQMYGARIAIDASSITSIQGARLCGLHIYVKADSSGAGGARSMIHFDDADVGLHNLFTFGNCDLDDSFFITQLAAASTKALRVMFGADTYYIMVTSCVD